MSTCFQGRHQLNAKRRQKPFSLWSPRRYYFLPPPPRPSAPLVAPLPASIQIKEPIFGQKALLEPQFG